MVAAYSDHNASMALQLVCRSPSGLMELTCPLRDHSALMGVASPLDTWLSAGLKASWAHEIHWPRAGPDCVEFSLSLC